jgi:hypothetical protein
MVWTHQLLVVGLLLVTGHLDAKPKKEEISLSFKNLRHYQIAIENGLYAVYRDGDRVLTAPRLGRFYISSRYNEAAKEIDLGFGTLKSPVAESERVPLAEGEKDRRFRSILPLDPYLLLLDSAKRQFVIWNNQDKVWHQPADLILDMIRPPADKGGEAPRAEVARLRSRFQKSYAAMQEDGDLIAGLAPIPRWWKDRDGSQFLLLLRLPETPILTVRCEGRHYSRCIAQRSCFVPNFMENPKDQPAGIAVHQDRKEIWIGQPQKMQILRLRSESCYRIQKSGQMGIPKEIRRLSHLFFDNEANLWLTNGEPDPLYSASLFRWDKAQVGKLLDP